MFIWACVKCRVQLFIWYLRLATLNTSESARQRRAQVQLLLILLHQLLFIYQLYRPNTRFRDWLQLHQSTWQLDPKFAEIFYICFVFAGISVHLLNRFNIIYRLLYSFAALMLCRLSCCKLIFISNITDTKRNCALFFSSLYLLMLHFI